jgi:hypothetical protein
MQPERAARLLAQAGGLLLALLVLLRVLSLGETAQTQPDAPLAEGRPISSLYRVSPDSRQVIFWQAQETYPPQEGLVLEPAWYSFDIANGQVQPADRPEDDILPFVLDKNQLFLRVGDGYSLTTGSPPESTVQAAALSPDRKMMAFSAARDRVWGLYILHISGQLDWLGDEESIIGLAWSADSQRLAYIAPRNGISQVFAIDRSGSQLVQLTHDDLPKHAPVWLAGGQDLVYRADPPAPETPADAAASLAPPSASIYLTGADRPAPELLAGPLPGLDGPASVSEGRLIAYTLPTPGSQRLEQLFFLDPLAKTSRRIYPPWTIDSLECPVALPGGQQSTLAITLSNSGPLPASLPLVLRAASRPIPVIAGRDEAVLRIESVDLGAGQTSRMEWAVRPANGLVSYFSVIINQGDSFPMAEMGCAVRNTSLGLPNLGFLPATLPLAGAGMLLLLPWLRHRKKKWLWALWLVYPFAVAALIAVEVLLAGKILGG